MTCSTCNDPAFIALGDRGFCKNCYAATWGKREGSRMYCQDCANRDTQIEKLESEVANLNLSNRHKADLLAARDEQIAGVKRELEEARRFSIESLVKILQKADETNGKCFVEEFLQIKQRAETAEARVQELEVANKKVVAYNVQVMEAAMKAGFATSIGKDGIYIEHAPDLVCQMAITRAEEAEARVSELISAAEPFIEDVEYLDGITDDCECDISVWVGSAITPHREKVFPKDWARLRTISVWVGELRALAAAVQKARQQQNGDSDDDIG